MKKKWQHGQCIRVLHARKPATHAANKSWTQNGHLFQLDRIKKGWFNHFNIYDVTMCARRIDYKRKFGAEQSLSNHLARLYIEWRIVSFGNIYFRHSLQLCRRNDISRSANAFAYVGEIYSKFVCRELNAAGWQQKLDRTHWYRICQDYMVWFIACFQLQIHPPVCMQNIWAANDHDDTIQLFHWIKSSMARISSSSSILYIYKSHMHTFSHVFAFIKPDRSTPNYSW